MPFKLIRHGKEYYGFDVHFHVNELGAFLKNLCLLVVK